MSKLKKIYVTMDGGGDDNDEYTLTHNSILEAVENTETVEEDESVEVFEATLKSIGFYKVGKAVKKVRTT